MNEITKEYFDQAILGLKIDIGGVKTEVTLIKEDIISMQVDIGFIREDVATLQSDVSIMKEDIMFIQEDIYTTKKDLRELSEKVENISTRDKEDSDAFAHDIVSLQKEFHKLRKQTLKVTSLPNPTLLPQRF